MNPLSDEWIVFTCPHCKRYVRLEFDEKGHLKKKVYWKRGEKHD